MTTRILVGDVRARLADIPDSSIHCVVTSPPYYSLRDYQTGTWDGGDAGCDHIPGRSARTERAAGSLSGSLAYVAAQEPTYRSTCGKCGAVRVDAQIGLEPTLAAYIATLVDVFRDVRRVLRDDGVVFLNLGDSYCGGGGFSPGAPSSGESKSGKYGSLGALKSGGIKPQGGLKPKDLMMVPARVAIALQQPWLRCRGCNAEHHESQWATFPNGRRICPSCELSKGADASEPGFYLRSDIIWAKPNPMPESVTDRPTSAHEHVFLLSKRPTYYYDAEAIREETVEPWGGKDEGVAPSTKDHHEISQSAIRNGTGRMGNNPAGRNRRNVWTIATTPYPGAHFATFPPKLVEPMILAGCPVGGTVLDPFGGAGTVGLVADRLGRDAILIELNPEYARMAAQRIRGDAPMFAGVEVA